MKVSVLAALLTFGLGTTFATTTDKIEVKLGTADAKISDNGTCTDISGTLCTTLSADLNPADGNIFVTGTAGNWTISETVGDSNSPSDVPFGLDLNSLTATCTVNCAVNSLEIEFSDKNFSPANPSFVTGYSLTLTGGSGSTSESAYYSNTNNDFAETTLIGTVGPLTATGAGSATGGVGSVSPYSLTLDQIFTATGTGAVSFSVDGSVASVPEPGALILFGTVLVFCTSKLRRRTS